MNPFWLIAISSLATAAALSCRNQEDQWISSGALSAEQKAKIVEVHNAMRNKVASGGEPGQPPAQNMREMVWDENLARQAQKWANNCVFEHDPDISKPNSEGDYVGQNLYLAFTDSRAGVDNLNVEGGVMAWYNEVHDNYQFQKITVENYFPTGHYTQMVWADTYKVGCGYTAYKNGEWYNQLLACNYFKSGNEVGKAPYVSGKPNCKKFNLNKSKKFGSLCV